MRRLLPLLFFTALALAARAQSVRWEPAGGSLALGRTSELSLVFSGCEPKGQPELPAVPGLDFGLPDRNEQNSFNIIDGRASLSKTVILSYPVRPSTKAELHIPVFTVETDAGPQTVRPATFSVGEATVGRGVSIADVVQSRFDVPAAPVWAGEVFPLTYSLSGNRSYLMRVGNPDWEPAPIVAEGWDRPVQLETMRNGQPYVSLTYLARALAPASAGEVALASASQLVILTTPEGLNQYTVSSAPAKLTVKPLPAPSPAGFAGAVGAFTLSAKVVPQTAAVGEPVTWTLELSGTGNWPVITGLPPRSVSKDFRVVQPRATRTPADGKLFDATLSEDVVLIPTKPGAYTLGPVTYTVFDPKSGAYKTLKTEPVTLNVTPSATSASTPPSSVAPTSGLPSSATTSAVTPPAAIPRDPLPAASAAASPLSPGALRLGLLAAGLWPLPLWLGLALRRARRNDPLRPQREARRRLAHTLSHLAVADDSRRASLLLAWQRDTAALFDLHHAVPLASHFTDPVWAALWTGSERALYQSGAALDPAWLDEARRALDAHHLRPFSVWSLFRPANLLPFLVIALAFAVPAETRAAEPAAAYAAGDFAAAEAGWRSAAQRTPTAWAVRHNLSLALAQQDRWPEAAAEAAAAAAQHPRDPKVRWQLTLSLLRAGSASPEVAMLVEPGPVHELARLASPFEWQLALIASAALLALALALALLRAYGRRRRSLKAAAWTCAVAALLLAAAALLALRAYGPLAAARAVIVHRGTTLRSVPTEADTAQKTTALAAGTVARVEADFLGWRRLAFPNGQTGWVRQDDLTGLWRTP